MGGTLPSALVRHVWAVVAGAVLAAVGAVVLGEYDLQGATAVVGFPLFGIAVAEVAMVPSKRLAVATRAALAAVTGAALSWSLWISFGHFVAGGRPPALSWAMVVVGAAAAYAWGGTGERRGAAPTDAPTGRNDP
jgi:hypothetical protein